MQLNVLKAVNVNFDSNGFAREAYQSPEMKQLQKDAQRGIIQHVIMAH